MQTLAPVEVVAAFGLEDATISGTDVGRIHETSIANGAEGKWVLQRINTDVFEDPEALMENAIRTRACVLAAGGQALDYRLTRSASLLATDDDGGAWRSYQFVDGTVTERPSDVVEVDRIARAFGMFISALDMYEPTDWHQVLPQFHDHARRVADLRDAVRLDRFDRVADATADVDVLLDVIETLEGTEEFEAWGQVPVRVAHHDAKCVNAVEGVEGTTILDLDTVMAGTILSDIGELVRSCARRSDGNSQAFLSDHARHAIQGFLQGWDGVLADSERLAVPIAGLMMTAQNATRFMTDHLTGDRYYKRDAEPLANLERCRRLVGFAQAQLQEFDQLRRIATTLA